MNIVVITDDRLKEELLAQNVSTDATIEFYSDIPVGKKADCYIDLLYDHSSRERGLQLAKLLPSLVIVNAVMGNPATVPMSVVRINGWPTLLRRAVVEAWHLPVIFDKTLDDSFRKKVEEVFACFGKKVEWMETTFITPRIISMIINEAYYALDEKVSTKEDIDIAMKLGTNYPYGPFEWGQKIGLKKIYELLKGLSEYPDQKRYEPSPLLKQEALQA